MLNFLAGALAGIALTLIVLSPYVFRLKRELSETQATEAHLINNMIESVNETYPIDELWK